MKKLNIGLMGATGKMGKELVALIGNSKEFNLSIALSSTSKVNLKEAHKIDIWVDFSNADVFDENLSIALKSQKPLVCGTTGLSEKQKKQLNQVAKKIPVLWSSNMSIGVAVLNEAIKSFSKIKNFDFQIQEIHHAMKKDSPSGTAVTLQENLNKIVNKKNPAPQAIRAGGVYGIHKVLAVSQEEMLSFEHTAINRTVFARGALHAAEWLYKQKPGFYSMKECLFGNQ